MLRSNLLLNSTFYNRQRHLFGLGASTFQVNLPLRTSEPVLEAVAESSLSREN